MIHNSEVFGVVRPRMNYYFATSLLGSTNLKDSRAVQMAA
jgi:hypothetical protein